MIDDQLRGGLVRYINWTFTESVLQPGRLKQVAGKGISIGNTVWKTTQLVALVCALLAKPALAGTNAGFSVVVDPAEIRGPAVGERIDLAVEIQGAVETKHALLVARYDSSLFSFVEFAPGDLIEGLVAPPGIPEEVDGGLLEIQSGGTQLSAPRE